MQHFKRETKYGHERIRQVSLIALVLNDRDRRNSEPRWLKKLFEFQQRISKINTSSLIYKKCKSIRLTFSHAHVDIHTMQYAESKQNLQNGSMAIECFATVQSRALVVGTNFQSAKRLLSLYLGDQFQSEAGDSPEPPISRLQPYLE